MFGIARTFRASVAGGLSFCLAFSGLPAAPSLAEAATPSTMMVTLPARAFSALWMAMPSQATPPPEFSRAVTSPSSSASACRTSMAVKPVSSHQSPPTGP